jgi:hypothetical protein
VAHEAAERRTVREQDREVIEPEQAAGRGTSTRPFDELHENSRVAVRGE